MVVLRTLLLASLATACYSPDVRDCTVTCSAVADCAPGQVCGDDGFCAAEDVAGHCASIAATGDAGADAQTPDAPRDARPDAPPDPTTTVTLTVRIDGRGDVVIPTIGTCGGGNGQTICPFVVPKNHWRFERWDDACSGSPSETCSLVPTGNVLARVRFEAEDDAL